MPPKNSSSTGNTDSPNQQKTRRGLSRMIHATRYSFDGLKRGWKETAFRQEACLAMVMIPASFWIGRNCVEMAVLDLCVVFVLVTELLNTAIEAVVDRISPEWHELSGNAKDLGSAAVFLSILLCSGVWLSAIFLRWSS